MSLMLPFNYKTPYTSRVAKPVSYTVLRNTVAIDD